MRFLNRILMDKAEETGSASGYGTEAAAITETATQTQTQGDSTNSTSANAAGTTATKDQSAEASNQSKQATDEDVTGYNSSDKGDTKETVVMDDKPLELDSKGIPEEEIKSVQEFAKAHKLSKEQAQGLVDKLKSDVDAVTAKQEAFKAEESKVYKKWEEDLKADPDFGGGNFDQNVHTVNKLIREELPALKNLLTTSGKRLPPSVMKDLNNVARKLYGETELVDGAKAGTTNSWHPTDFYKQKQ